jgi:hypothetical protein
MPFQICLARAAQRTLERRFEIVDGGFLKNGVNQVATPNFDHLLIGHNASLPWLRGTKPRISQSVELRDTDRSLRRDRSLHAATPRQLQKLPQWHDTVASSLDSHPGGPWKSSVAKR